MCKTNFPTCIANINKPKFLQFYSDETYVFAETVYSYECNLCNKIDTFLPFRICNNTNSSRSSVVQHLLIKYTPLKDFAIYGSFQSSHDKICKYTK